MPLPTVVIAQTEPAIALELANDLQAHFARVEIAESATDLFQLLLRHEARVAILDLELVSMEEVRHLSRTFGDLSIVCTHRSPDERLWMSALSAGAVEFCHPHDILAILRASRLTPKRLHLATAA